MIPGRTVVPILVAFTATSVLILLGGWLMAMFTAANGSVVAVAVDDRLTFWEAWAVSGGNGFAC